MRHSFQIHDGQHAFQQGKSTESALHELVTQIEDNFDKKEYLIATFMDIAGAFDNISFEAVNTHVVSCGLHIQITNWIKYLLSHRSIHVETTGKQVIAKAARGTPQGSVLSPTLWILVMDSLLKRLQSDGHTAIGYADDLTVICRGKDLSTMSNRTQQAIKIVEMV